MHVTAPHTEFSKAKWLARAARRHMRYFQAVEATPEVAARAGFQGAMDSKTMSLSPALLSHALGFCAPGVRGNSKVLVYDATADGLLCGDIARRISLPVTAAPLPYSAVPSMVVTGPLMPKAVKNALSAVGVMRREDIDEEGNVTGVGGRQLLWKSFPLWRFVSAEHVPEYTSKEVRLLGAKAERERAKDKADAEKKEQEAAKEAAKPVDAPEAKRPAEGEEAAPAETKPEAKVEAEAVPTPSIPMATDGRPQATPTRLGCMLQERHEERRIEDGDYTEAPWVADCMVIACICDPLPLVRALTPLVRPGAPVAIMTPTLTPLASVMQHIKISRAGVEPMLYETALERDMQVLPMRTRPGMRSPGGGCFLLTYTAQPENLAPPEGFQQGRGGRGNKGGRKNRRKGRRR
ncbi:tRNA (adenine(58)-N(1))-methyltransferase non-catalytic subunit TRM6 [Kipferlia bialata]|uniref:tRNA (adenine(58)-N(1))-methyltransferase non-catalytic subunit TRM6 n=1 Tax=Kipferlia bialata TaxID=797122 RepID=A0A9K3CPA1_9EUKA|nr:tRNA (adenine(58)-N(1))-methyltransferase non-catalytic subunit TRM6 [Kipferlia bialata]|eukprot:g1655.t1